MNHTDTQRSNKRLVIVEHWINTMNVWRVELQAFSKKFILAFISKMIKWKILWYNNNNNNNQNHRSINVIIATNERFPPHSYQNENNRMMAERTLFVDVYEWIIKINFSFWLNIKSSMGSKNVYHHHSRHVFHSSNEWSKK